MKLIHVIILSILVLNVLHGIYHLMDWLVWGMQMNEPHLREPLSALFGHHMLGWTLHAVTNLSMIILGWFLYWKAYHN